MLMQDYKPEEKERLLINYDGLVKSQKLA